MRYSIVLKSIFLISFLCGIGAQAHSAGSDRRQLGFYGFKGKHVIVSVNTLRVFDETILDGVRYLFCDIPAHSRLSITVDSREQSEDLDLGGRVVGLEMRYGNPVSVVSVEYSQGQD